MRRESFIGKWKSSRLLSPLILYENGEWEILKDDGGVFQYGVWEYREEKLTWYYKIDGQTAADANTVLSVTPQMFQLREKDGSTTTFTRLN